MATRFYLRRTSTHPGATNPNDYIDMTTAKEAAAAAWTAPLSLQLPSERFYTLSSGGTPVIPLSMWSERFTEQFTLSGTITFNLWTAATSLPSGRLRVRLTKITKGGSNVETEIVTAEPTTNLSASATVHSFTATPATSTVIAIGERLVLRVYVFNPAGGDPATTLPADLLYDAASGNGVSWIELTETVGTKVNGSKLYLRRTATNGIGNFFDMLATRGSSAATTGVVNTVSGGSNIQWTRTAGGTLLEWISPRFKEAWEATAFTNTFSAYAWVHESAAAANCAVRGRFQKRKPDGTETFLWIYSGITEMGTSPGFAQMSSGNMTPGIFAEDDRLVFRMYIIPPLSLTMGGSRTCTVTYDHNVADAIGDSYINILNSADFKSESDPAAARIPDGQSMSGIGN